MQKIKTLQELQDLLSRLNTTEQDKYWQTLHSLIPIIRYTKQYTHQKNIAPYLDIHPSKLSTFMIMTQALLTHTIDNSHIDMEALKDEIRRKWWVHA